MAYPIMLIRIYSYVSEFKTKLAAYFAVEDLLEICLKDIVQPKKRGV
jgi:hypothetical protein